MRAFVTILAVAVFTASLAFAGIMGLYAYYARDLPDPSELSRRQVFQTARIFDRNGQLLEEIDDPSGGRRTLVALAQIPRSLRDATVAAEDASFYENPGFDPRAIVRAAYQFVRYGSPQSGASTITQQLVKNTLLGPEQTAERKIKEAFLAMELTRRYSKDEILEMYLNEINYGNRAYGVEAASQTYFGKPARDLTLPEASLLAGLPQAPAYYDPYANLAAAKERQRYVLEQMARTGTISSAERDAALRAPIQLRSRTAAAQPRAPHFVTWVRQLLEDQLGADALYRSGLQVTTSLDLDAQQVAEHAARQHIDAIRARNATNAALVSIRPSTGEILAMLGSVDFDDPKIDGQVNVALAPRQPGSTLKPFTYLTAFAKGWNPATPLMDIPTVFGGSYRPNDYDNKFRGVVRVRQALAQSLNIPAVEALQFTGISAMLDTAHRMGIQGLREPDRYGLSVTLGGGEVRLLDLTYAYAGLAAGGRQVGAPVPENRRQAGFRQFDPVAILKIADSSGKVLYQYVPPEPVQVADPRLVYQVTSILSDDEARAPTYGRNSALVLPGRPSAVKTGTTDDYTDSWVVGYTPDLVTGVWVGNSDNSPMKDVLGVAGAGQIWHAYMEEVLKGSPPSSFVVPRGVQEAEVCGLTALLPTAECRENDLPIHGTVRDVFVPGVNLPTKQDDLHQRIEVCKINGKLVVPVVPPNAREQRVFVAFPEPYRAWAAANGYPAPPAERCDDVYRGERKVEIGSPRRGDRIGVGTTVQVTGGAYVDDFHHYTLDVGPGDNPNTWATLTDRRTQAVDNGLLGVWNTSGQQPGPYTLRLRVFDSFDDVEETRLSVVLSALTPTPTPASTPPATPTPVGPRTPAPTAPTRTPEPRSTPAATPKPGA